MSTILIEKYVDGVRVEEFKLPAGPLKFLLGLVPAPALQELQSHGLDLKALLNNSVAAPQWLDVEEAHITKRVCVSRQD